MSNEMKPENIDNPDVHEKWDDALDAIWSYVEACAPYPVSAEQIERDFAEALNKTVSSWLDFARSSAPRELSIPSHRIRSRLTISSTRYEGEE